MKIQGVFLITALAATMAFAQDKLNNPSATATTTIDKTKTKLLEKVFKPERKDEGKIDRSVDGLSSQAWATTVGWKTQPLFADSADRETGLYVVSVGTPRDPYQK